jgi:ketosteroid isomerase-like protein
VSRTDNAELVRALYEAFARRDVEAALELIHPACDFRPFGTSNLTGRDEPYVGHEGIRRYFADVAEHWDDLVVEPLDFRSAGTSVIVFGNVRGRSADSRADTQATWIWKVRDGLAIDGRVFPTGGL